MLRFASSYATGIAGAPESAKNETIEEYLSPWANSLSEDPENVANIIVVCVVSAFVVVAFLVDIFRPAFLKRMTTLSTFKRPTMKFRYTRTLSWIVLYLIRVIQVMSRTIVYFIISSTAHKFGLDDEHGGYVFHWLVFGTYLIMPLASTVFGFVLDFKWKNSRHVLYLVLAIHALACFIIGYVITRHNYSKEAVISVFCIGYVVICLCQTFTGIMKAKIIVRWYPSKYINNEVLIISSTARESHC
jgi:hypothetical protein